MISKVKLNHTCIFHFRGPNNKHFHGNTLEGKEQERTIFYYFKHSAIIYQYRCFVMYKQSYL